VVAATGTPWPAPPMPHSRMAVEQSSTVDEFSRLLTPGAEDGSVNAETDLLTGGPGAVKVLRQELKAGTGTTYAPSPLWRPLLVGGRP